MFMSKEHVVATCLAVACGIVLLLFLRVNEYKRVERWFYYHDKYMYILLEFCYYILFISFVFNARFLAYELIALFLWKFYRIKMKI
jgi:hypothetical protein